jgi:hypothetical protein
MSFEVDLRSKLVNDAAVSAIVGSKVYPQFRPQGSTLPAVLLTIVYGARDKTFDGAMATQGNQVQFDCMASTKAEVTALRNAVIDAIEAPSTVGSTEFQGGTVDLYRDSYDDTDAGVVWVDQIRATIWFN